MIGNYLICEYCEKLYDDFYVWLRDIVILMCVIFIVFIGLNMNLIVVIIGVMLIFFFMILIVGFGFGLVIFDMCLIK